jgi:hypothetical protein
MKFHLQFYGGIAKNKKQLNSIIQSNILSTGRDALSNYLTQKPFHYFSPFVYFVWYNSFQSKFAKFIINLKSNTKQVVYIKHPKKFPSVFWRRH